MTPEQIKSIIFDVISNFNQARESNEQIPLSEDTKLFGREGCLDSIGLVGFLIDVEDAFSQQGLLISLSDERAMSQSRSPYRDVKSLIDFIHELLNEGGRSR